MRYIDIHTHLQSHEENVLSVLNRITGRDELLHDGSLQSCGIHPWYIDDEGARQLEQIELSLRDDSVIALGEIGMDKMVGPSLRLQQSLFEEEVRMSETIRKPVVIHCVKAWEELMAVHKILNPSMPWIVHGFRGGEELARQLLSHGLYLSFGEKFHEESLRAAWPDHLFAETDESSLTISAIYDKLSTAVPVNVETFAEQMEKNFEEVFG